MRPRTILSDLQQETRSPASRPGSPSSHDTYERVRRTLDEALAELQLPVLDRDDTSRLIKLHQPSR
jgi:hypothetical protein